LTVFLGDSGHVELVRRGIADGLQGEVSQSFVNVKRSTFSFDFPVGALLTGDCAEFRSLDGSPLDFVAENGWESDQAHDIGKWFIHVDQVGGIRLYKKFSDAVAGEEKGRISLRAISRTIKITVSVANSEPRMVGQVVSYVLSTDRETIDTSSLGDEFREQYSTLMSGSGHIECFFDYRHLLCSEVPETAELAIYMHSLLLRQRFGAEFAAKFYIISEGAATGTSAGNDSVWYEINGLITHVGLSCTGGEPVHSSIDFVTTGEIKLKVATVTEARLLLESGGKIRLQDSQGYLLLEDEN
jgi:hypothetical protein